MKKTIINILEAKNKRKLVCTTAYTYPVAKLISDLNFDIILIGDSLGMEINGYTSTISVTLEEVIYHSKAVSRANTNCFIVGDMPFLSTDVSVEESIRNAGRLIQAGFVDAVKIEGNKNKSKTIKAIIDAGIPVMGHIGLNPQKILNLGKYSVQGKKPDEEKELLESAKALEEAGVFSIVLECMPEHLGKTITDNISVPTIGIGAGVHCDGQILVSNDIFGMSTHFRPKFVKAYGKINELMINALNSYKQEVETSTYPSKEFSY